MIKAMSAQLTMLLMWGMVMIPCAAGVAVFIIKGCRCVLVSVDYLFGRLLLINLMPAQAADCLLCIYCLCRITFLMVDK